MTPDNSTEILPAVPFEKRRTPRTRQSDDMELYAAAADTDACNLAWIVDRRPTYSESAT